MRDPVATAGCKAEPPPPTETEPANAEDSRDKMADVLLEPMKTLGNLEPVTDGRLTDVAQP